MVSVGYKEGNKTGQIKSEEKENSFNPKIRCKENGAT